jgi:hypothetical protein
MGLGVGNLGNIVQDFKDSISGIFGGGGSSGANSATKGGDELFGAKIGGSVQLQQEKWIGNAGGDKRFVKYGFATMNLQQVQGASPSGTTMTSVYYLDIAPQSIQQKEVFANNIQATRKGVIVETEGVVFRDIVISGTTGIFPGKRGEANNPQANFSDFTSPPKGPAGVDANTGLSTANNVPVSSGYEEFIKLRQFFLAYAQKKVETDGNLFLIFLNQKDNQLIIVEPMEFIMERNSKSPMTYNYRIVLKGIGDLNALFGNTRQDDGPLGFLEKVGNASANIQAAIQQGRAAFNKSIQLLTRISQSVDQTINGPLRQIQFASEDLKDGVATVFSLPEILIRNTTSAILTTRENLNAVGNTVNTAIGGSGFRVASSSDRASASATFSQQRDIVSKIQDDNRVSIPRSFIENNKNQMNELSNNLADFVGLGDTDFDAIKGRTSTLQPDALKVVSDEEALLLGEFMNVSSALNIALASNIMFQPDAEIAFEEASQEFSNPALPQDQQIQIAKPKSVREIIINRNDTLERIAQREYGNALRWIDIVVLNSLKPPYIDSVASDGVKAPGDKLMIGVD